MEFNAGSHPGSVFFTGKINISSQLIKQMNECFEVLIK